MSESSSAPSQSFRYVTALLALVLLVAGWGMSMNPLWVTGGVAGLVAVYGLDLVARNRNSEDGTESS